jgi:hypothetical protein
VPNVVSLWGSGWVQEGDDAFGSSDYHGNASGSVLYATQTSGVAILYEGSTYGPTDPGGSDRTGTFNIQNLCLIGPGSGSGTGIQISQNGEYLVNGYVNNVEVCNFSLCWDLHGIENSSFVSWHARGCKTGIQVGDSSAGTNACTFITTEVSCASTNAVVVTGALNNKWMGMILQGCSGATSYLTTSGQSNSYDTVYLETGASPPTTALIHSSGNNNEYRNWFSGDSSGKMAISIDAGNRNIVSNMGGATVSVNVASGTYQAIEWITSNSGFSGVTGAGAGNCICMDVFAGVVSPAGFYNSIGGSKLT